MQISDEVFFREAVKMTTPLLQNAMKDSGWEISPVVMDEIAHIVVCQLNSIIIEMMK